MDLQDFNSAPAGELRPALTACCDVPRWVDGLLAMEAILAGSIEPGTVVNLADEVTFRYEVTG